MRCSSCWRTLYSSWPTTTGLKSSAWVSSTSCPFYAAASIGTQPPQLAHLAASIGAQLPLLVLSRLYCCLYWYLAASIGTSRLYWYTATSIGTQPPLKNGSLAASIGRSRHYWYSSRLCWYFSRLYWYRGVTVLLPGWVIWKYWNCPCKFFFLGSWQVSSLCHLTMGEKDTIPLLT